MGITGKFSIVSVAALLSSLTLPQKGPYTFTSFEALIAPADTIFTANIVEFQKKMVRLDKGPRFEGSSNESGEYWTYTVKVKVKQRLQGRPKDEQILAVGPILKRVPYDDWLKNKTELLIYIKPVIRDKDSGADFQHGTTIWNFICLEPYEVKNPEWFYHIPMISSDLTLIKTRTEAINRAKRFISQKKQLIGLEKIEFTPSPEFVVSGEGHRIIVPVMKKRK